MQNLIFPLAALFACMFSFFLFLRDGEKTPSLQTEEKQPERGVLIYSAVMIVLTVALSVLIPRLFPESSPMSVMKRVLLISVIWPVAYIDFKTYRIPNAFVLFGLVVRAVLLVFELLQQDDIWKYTLISEGVAAGALFAAAMLCGICFKGSIGFGDVKMFVVLGLFLGMEGSWSAIFSALLISLAVAIVLLATKKKGRKDAIPFGPAIVLGTYLSVCLTGM